MLALGAAVVAFAGGGESSSPSASGTPASLASPGIEEGPTESRLAADATAYTRAVLAGESLELKDLLSITCHGTDPKAVLTRRREEIGTAVAAAGGTISALSATEPLLAHFDPAAGIAHAVLGLTFEGKRVLLPVADGWLYEDGRWRNSDC